MVSAEILTAETAYPRPGLIACQIVERSIGTDHREIVVIDTEQPWGVEATTGETRFSIFPEQLAKLD